MATKNQIPFLLLPALSQAALCVRHFLMEFRLCKPLSLFMGRVFANELMVQQEMRISWLVVMGLGFLCSFKQTPEHLPEKKIQATFRLPITSLGLCAFWPRELQLWLQSLANLSRGGALQPGAVELCWGTCQSLMAPSGSAGYPASFM